MKKSSREDVGYCYRTSGDTDVLPAHSRRSHSADFNRFYNMFNQADTLTPLAFIGN